MSKAKYITYNVLCFVTDLKFQLFELCQNFLENHRMLLSKQQATSKQVGTIETGYFEQR